MIVSRGPSGHAHHPAIHVMSDALLATQIALAREQNIVLGAEYFRGQDISYLFGYLLFALVFGWVFGMLGAALARNQLQAKS